MMSLTNGSLIIIKSNFSSFIVTCVLLKRKLCLPKISWTYSLLFFLVAPLFHLLVLRFIIFLKLKFVCEFRGLNFCSHMTIKLTQYHLFKDHPISSELQGYLCWKSSKPPSLHTYFWILYSVFSIDFSILCPLPHCLNSSGWKLEV